MRDTCLQILKPEEIIVLLLDEKCLTGTLFSLGATSLNFACAPQVRASLQDLFYDI
jgi:hypothetical protein